MRLYYMPEINPMVFFLLFFIAGFSLPQDIKTLSLNDAVEQALNNNNQLKYQNYELKKAEGLLTKSGILPNPAASYYKEDLSEPNSSDYNEWTISGSMPLNFLWDRWTAVNSASSFYEAEKYRYENLKSQIISNVKSAFTKVHFYNEINSSWQKAFEIIEQANKTAEAREIEGDISGYDKQRILLEYLLYKKNESESKINYQNALNELAMLVYSPDSLFNIKTSFNYNASDSLLSFQSLIETAKFNRSDLKAAILHHESKSLSLSNEKLKIIPDLSFNIGYKKQSDNLKGLVYGFNIGIPLFNRNQGDIEIAEAELNQQIVFTESLSKKIELEVSAAYKMYKEYEEQLKSYNQYRLFDSEDIISTARFSYEEGEMSLIELIDALRAYTGSFHLKNEMLLNYYLSLFELEKTIGKELNQ